MRRLYQIFFLLAIYVSCWGQEHAPCKNLRGQSPEEKRNADALNIKGMEYYKFQQVEKAIELFETAARLYPNDAQSWSNLGVVYNIILKRPVEAIDYLQKAVCLDDSFPSVHYYLGTAYLHAKKYDAAIASFQKAAGHETDKIEIYNNLAACYMKTGKHEKALAILQKSIEKKPDDYYLLNNVGSAQFYLKRFEDAARTFMKAIKVNPNEAHALYNLGVVYLKLNNKQAALRQYETLNGIDEKWSKLLYQGIYRDKVLVLSGW